MECDAAREGQANLRAMSRWSSRRETPRRWRRALTAVRLLAATYLFCSLAGCASVRVTDPDRTATEQFLLSSAATEAVEQLSFESLRGRKVYVDSTYFAASEEKFVLGELRAKLFLGGVELVPEFESADVILEVRSGGVGIDRYDFLLGLPSVAVSADPDNGDSSGFSVPFVTPELAIVKNIDQIGIASVAYVAYWRETGEVVALSGPFIGRSNREDWWFFGWGPRTLGDIPPATREVEHPDESAREGDPKPAPIVVEEEDLGEGGPVEEAIEEQEGAEDEPEIKEPAPVGGE